MSNFANSRDGGAVEEFAGETPSRSGVRSVSRCCPKRSPSFQFATGAISIKLGTRKDGSMIREE
ncbi:MAG: hypothetical protein ABJB10_14260 [Mesorhizobium sp.]